MIKNMFRFIFPSFFKTNNICLCHRTVLSFFASINWTWILLYISDIWTFISFYVRLLTFHVQIFDDKTKERERKRKRGKYRSIRYALKVAVYNSLWLNRISSLVSWQRVSLIIRVTACRRAVYLSVVLSVAHLTYYYSRRDVIDIMTMTCTPIVW